MLHNETTPSGAERRVQRATRADIPAIADLMRRAQAEDGIPRISEAEIGELMAHGQMIVLSNDHDELVAAACLTASAGRGHLAFLVVDPRDPMTGDAEARIRSAAA